MITTAMIARAFIRYLRASAVLHTKHPAPRHQNYGWELSALADKLEREAGPSLHARTELPPMEWRQIDPHPRTEPLRAPEVRDGLRDKSTFDPRNIHYITDRPCIRVEVRHPKGDPYAKYTSGIACFVHDMKDAFDWAKSWPAACEVHIVPHDPRRPDGGFNRMLEHGLARRCAELEKHNADLAQARVRDLGTIEELKRRLDRIREQTEQLTLL